MAKKDLRAYKDAMKDIEEEYPRLVPIDHTRKRKYKGKPVDWFVSRSMRELGKYDKEIRETETTDPKYTTNELFRPLFDQIGIELDQNGNLLEETTFDQILPLLPDDQMICVGSGTGYFFMGSAAEYKEIVPLIERVYGLQSAFIGQVVINRYHSGAPFNQRIVKEVFVRDFPDEPVMMAISLEGNELSPFILYEEYQRGKARNWPYVWPGYNLLASPELE